MVALLLLAGSALLGFALLPRRVTSRAVPGLFLALSTGLLAFGWTTWVVGTLAGTRALPLLWIALLAASARAARPFAGAARRALRRLGLLCRAAPLACAALVLGFLALGPALLLPVVDSDGVRYHVALPRLFLLEGRVSYYPWDVTGALPQTAEMANLAGLALGSAEASKLLHAALFAASLAALALTVHRGRRTRAASLLAPSFLLFAPVASIPATAAFVDHAATFHLATALLWLVRGGSPAFSGLPLGAALATKVTAGPAVGALLLSLPFLSRKGSRLRSFAAASFAVAAAFAPFAIRNVLANGDPIFPIGRGLLGLPLPGISPERLRSVTQFRTVATGPLGLAWWDGIEGTSTDDVVGLPPLAALFALPVLLRERRSRVLLLPVLAHVAVALAFSLPSRFLLPALWALAAVLGLALSRLGRPAATAAALLLVAPGAFASTRFLLGHFRPVEHLLGRISREEAIAAAVPGYRAAARLRGLPPGRVMALDFPAAYYLDRPYVIEGILNTPPLRAWLSERATAADLERRLRALGIRYLLVTPGYGGGTPLSLLALTVPGDVSGVTALLGLRSRLTRLDTLDGVDVYELPPVGTSP